MSWRSVPGGGIPACLASQSRWVAVWSQGGVWSWRGLVPGGGGVWFRGGLVPGGLQFFGGLHFLGVSNFFGGLQFFGGGLRGVKGGPLNFFGGDFFLDFCFLWGYTLHPTRDQTPEHGQCSAGTHPTGMHSCAI